MMDLDFTFDAELWIYPAEKTHWHFITLPVVVSDEIKFFITSRNGFGSVRVTVTIGAMRWKTSIFPYKEAQSFILPIKKDVRAQENLHAGDAATINLYIPVDV